MEIIYILLLALFTFISRIINLTGIPIFTDEAIYIRWAQIGLNDAAHRYISLTDGKQPLMTWLMYPFLKLFSDPLFAGRFVSVLAGTAGVVGIYLVARELFGKRAAVFSSLIFIFSPFMLNYDRLALMDSLLGATGIWSLYIEILLVRKLRLDLALILGMVIGLGLLNKSSAFFFIYCLPFSLLLFKRKGKDRFRDLVKWAGLISVSTFISLVMYNSLRLSPWFYIINQKNHVFILSFSEFIRFPLSILPGNLDGLGGILISYLTVPVTVLLIGGLLLGLLKKEKKILMLFLWFAFPFFSLSAFGKVIYPRFILFMVYPLFIIIGYSINSIAVYLLKRNKIFFYCLILFFIYPVYQCYLLVADPIKADIPTADRKQLFDDWPSGYGVREVVKYIDEKSREGKVVLGTEGTFGLNPAAYEIYLGNNKNVEIKGYWPVNEVPADLLESAKYHPTYLVFKETQKIPSSWPLVLIDKFKRGREDSYLYFYRVDFPGKYL